MHDTRHPASGRTVRLSTKGQDPDALNGKEFRIEDWWDHLTGGSWMNASGNPAAMKYAMRSGILGLPLDDEVVYGHVNGFGHLVHMSEFTTEEE